MSTALALPNIAAMQKAAYSEEFKDVAGTFQAFLPYLSLFSSNSGLVKEGKIPLCHYGISVKSGEVKADVGKTPLVMFIAWRPKAMDTNGDKPMSFFKPGTPQFTRVKNTAKSGVQDNGCMFGPEYLVWIPGQGFATFFLGSTTARNASAMFQALMPGPDGVLKCGILNSQFIKNDKYSWHGPTVSPSDQTVEGPALEDLEAQVKIFLHPVDSVVEEAAPKDATEDMNR